MVDETPSETSPDELEGQLAAAAAASRPWGEMTPLARASCLRAVADALDAASDELVPLAVAETHLDATRLVGELGRTTFQLGLFADLVEEGAYVGVSIDHPDPAWTPGPRPDLRRMMFPWARSSFLRLATFLSPSRWRGAIPPRPWRRAARLC